MSALVGGEAAGETDDEGVGVDFVNDVHHCGGITLVGEPFFLEVAAYEVDEFVLEGATHAPDVFVGHIEDAFPSLGVALILEHLRAKHVPVEFFPFGSGPGGHVHTVGYVTYVAFLPSVAFPDTGKHLLGHFAVEPAHAVGFLTCVEREHAHREAFVGVGVLATHVHEVVPGNAETCGIFAHVLAEELFVEVVVTCGHGCVYSVERRSADEFESHIEVKTVFLHVVDEALEVEERCVTFVAVVKLALHTEFLEHEHATDAEKVFLLDAVFPVAAIELVGD